ncbi:sedoheptulokinase-like [Neocloeon triangulifer]|uniref:sedoheptulokinase-like n=1 Tax=Neocloeon triangulifer TaxID=2078957 RepID=UPI00286F0524|nr:sedoheptulokinase-like [Neocloeon triangulifer]XP_059483458.1 sedoheptulokinase-like [Neocloeon triangulifer]
MSAEYVLGVDIGTTSVKVNLIDISTKKPIARQTKDTRADCPSELGPAAGNKQDAARIASAFHGCVSRLPRDKLKLVTSIGVCGQMHGVVLWKQGSAWGYQGERLELSTQASGAVSAVYTWQDNRCTPTFLASLPHPESHLGLSSGFGIPTVFWMAKNKPERLEKYDRAGTIMDLIVAMLCQLEEPVMSSQNAASWGYFNSVTGEWNKQLLEDAGFPVKFLPHVIPAGGVAGNLKQTWLGIPAGTPVGAALGDLQCSVFANLLRPGLDAVINISTSAQLGFVMPNDFQPEIKSADEDISSVQYFPYFDGQYLAVAASLNGGNSLALFVKILQQWAHELGFSVPQDKVWQRILDLGAANESTTLQINPTLLGERHSPEVRGSASNIDPSNLSLGSVTRSLCQGIISNLLLMMPRDFLVSHGVERILGVGSAMTRNAVLQSEVSKQYELPLEVLSGGDAALGAGLSRLLHI